jgi:hypothetical protein
LTLVVELRLLAEGITQRGAYVNVKTAPEKFLKGSDRHSRRRVHQAAARTCAFLFLCYSWKILKWTWEEVDYQNYLAQQIYKKSQPSLAQAAGRHSSKFVCRCILITVVQDYVFEY